MEPNGTKIQIQMEPNPFGSICTLSELGEDLENVKGWEPLSYTTFSHLINRLLHRNPCVHRWRKKTIFFFIIFHSELKCSLSSFITKAMKKVTSIRHDELYGTSQTQTHDATVRPCAPPSYVSHLLLWRKEVLKPIVFATATYWMIFNQIDITCVRTVDRSRVWKPTHVISHVTACVNYTR